MSESRKKMDWRDKYSIAVGGAGGFCNSLSRLTEALAGGGSISPFIVQVCGWPIVCDSPTGDAHAYPVVRDYLPLYRRPMVGVRVGEVGDGLSHFFHGVDGMVAGVSASGGEGRSIGAVGIPLGGSSTGGFYVDASPSD